MAENNDNSTQKLVGLNQIDRLAQSLNAIHEKDFGDMVTLMEQLDKIKADKETLQRVEEMLGGKSLRYLTQEEYDALSDEEKSDEAIAYHITDSDTSDCITEEDLFKILPCYDIRENIVKEYTYDGIVGEREYLTHFVKISNDIYTLEDIKNFYDVVIEISSGDRIIDNLSLPFIPVNEQVLIENKLLFLEVLFVAFEDCELEGFSFTKGIWFLSEDDRNAYVSRFKFIISGEGEFKQLDKKFMTIKPGENVEGQVMIVRIDDEEVIETTAEVGAEIFNITGGRNVAVGQFSHAEGYSAQAIGEISHSEGFYTTATGNYSHVEGYETTAVGVSSHAEGEGTRALGNATHSEGNNTEAEGNYSHAEGNNTHTKGEASHAEGYDTYAIGEFSHVEGAFNYANKSCSHAEGSNSKADGVASHVEGFSNEAIGNYSHAEGYDTKAEGIGSHSEGSGTEARGNYSHAEGFMTIAMNDCQHVQGKLNIADEENKYAHIVGNGQEHTDDNISFTYTYSNAHTLDWDGNAWFAGDVTIGADNKKLATEEYVDSKGGANIDINAAASDKLNTQDKTIIGAINELELESFETKAELIYLKENALQDVDTLKSDNLNTIDKTIVGAINEVNESIENLDDDVSGKLNKSSLWYAFDDVEVVKTDYTSYLPSKETIPNENVYLLLNTSLNFVEGDYYKIHYQMKEVGVNLPSPILIAGPILAKENKNGIIFSEFEIKSYYTITMYDNCTYQDNELIKNDGTSVIMINSASSYILKSFSVSTTNFKLLNGKTIENAGIRFTTAEEKETWNNKADKSELFSGSYNDLTDKPEIPSVEGLATEEYVEQQIGDISNQLANKADKMVYTYRKKEFNKIVSTATTYPKSDYEFEGRMEFVVGRLYRIEMHNSNGDIFTYDCVSEEMTTTVGDISKGLKVSGNVMTEGQWYVDEAVDVNNTNRNYSNLVLSIMGFNTVPIAQYPMEKIVISEIEEVNTKFFELNKTITEDERTYWNNKQDKVYVDISSEVDKTERSYINNITSSKILTANADNYLILNTSVNLIPYKSYYTYITYGVEGSMNSIRGRSHTAALINEDNITYIGDDSMFVYDNCTYTDGKLVKNNGTSVLFINELSKNYTVTDLSIALGGYELLNDDFFLTHRFVTDADNFASQDYVDNVIAELREEMVVLEEDDLTIDGLVDESFPSLTTENKTLIGAINEINSENESLQGQINELFQNVSNGKELIASAITDKGVDASEEETFQSLSEKINLIPSGPPGSNIIGYINEENEIYVSLTELESGTYTLKFEDYAGLLNEFDDIGTVEV